DADSFASARTFEFLFAMRPEFLPFSSLHTPTGKVRAFTVAVYSAMRAFDDVGWSFTDPLLYTHPPTPLRMLNIGSWGCDYATRRKDIVGGITQEKWAAEAGRTQVAADEALVAMGIVSKPAKGSVGWWADEQNVPKYAQRLL